MLCDTHHLMEKTDKQTITLKNAAPRRHSSVEPRARASSPPAPQPPSDDEPRRRGRGEQLKTKEDVEGEESEFWEVTRKSTVNTGVLCLREEAREAGEKTWAREGDSGSSSGNQEEGLGASAAGLGWAKRMDRWKRGRARGVAGTGMPRSDPVQGCRRDDRSASSEEKDCPSRNLDTSKDSKSGDDSSSESSLESESDNEEPKPEKTNGELRESSTEEASNQGKSEAVPLPSRFL
ncbi:hypothetical protein J1605_017109 [Eschrichtius robustus]|uniref:Uncharacterized protein n=1 Tax=Eschrichtius robustus TaxID=9764 RepID=A0AB34I2Q1_ESCRO|nr:hypothetical protein J1605_017109 [Eschrichtius robustus]